MSRSEVPKTEALSPGCMRHRQKNRTRRALLDAAAELMRQGREPTVAEGAEVSEWALQSETARRTVLRLSLDPETGVRRRGHRIRWIAEALHPLQGKDDGA